MNIAEAYRAAMQGASGRSGRLVDVGFLPRLVRLPRHGRTKRSSPLPPASVPLALVSARLAILRFLRHDQPPSPAAAPALMSPAMAEGSGTGENASPVGTNNPLAKIDMVPSGANSSMLPDPPLPANRLPWLSNANPQGLGIVAKRLMFPLDVIS